MQFPKSALCISDECPAFYVFYLLLVSGSSHGIKTSYANLNDQKTGSKQIKLSFFLILSS